GRGGTASLSGRGRDTRHLGIRRHGDSHSKDHCKNRQPAANGDRPAHGGAHPHAGCATGSDHHHPDPRSDVHQRGAHHGNRDSSFTELREYGPRGGSSRLQGWHEESRCEEASTNPEHTRYDVKESQYQHHWTLHSSNGSACSLATFASNVIGITSLGLPWPCGEALSSMYRPHEKE